MTTTIQRWGNSQGIRIPKFLLEAVHWGENEKLSINVDEDRIIITKMDRRQNIMDLFEGYEGEYKPTEIDWGKPEGSEIW